jgi:hypothetical protein
MNPAKAFPPAVPPSDDDVSPITPRVPPKQFTPPPEAPRARRLSTRKLPPLLPQDCDQTSFWVELPSVDRKCHLPVHVVVSHVGEQVHHVAFSGRWMHTIQSLGRDPEDSHVQSWIWVEAADAFARMPRVG